MTRYATIAAAVLALAAAAAPAGGEDANQPPDRTLKWLESLGSFEALARKESLSDRFLGYVRPLEEAGLAVALGLTQVYQQNLRGGLAMHRHAGRYTGSYDLEATADLEKLARIPGASFHLGAEGSWSGGLDDSSIGSLFGVNGDAAGNRSIDLTHAYWEQLLFSGRLQFRLGKIDLTGAFECRGCPVAFDASAYANDETAQFLNGALVNNPTIPFPDYGLGAAVFLLVTDWWYVSAGAGDAQADARETGFNTTFHDEDYFFAIYETGVVVDVPSLTGPAPASYRVGFWHDPQPKERFDDGSLKRDDMGLYVSADQMLWKENADPNDAQGLGAFLRWGYAHSEVSEVRCFWSAGAQYQGLLPGRDDDVLGVGFATGDLSPDAGFDETHESVLEIYYNAAVTPWLNVSPSLQYIWDPGGTDGVGDACVVGVRVQMLF